MILIKSSTALKVEPRGRMQRSLQMQQQTTQHALYEFCQSVWAISIQEATSQMYQIFNLLSHYRKGNHQKQLYYLGMSHK